MLVDNPNFNRKIPTNVEIQLIGNLLKPDDPVFDITFPNATGIVVSEINYRLADQQRRQLQAISLLSQGIFISDVLSPFKVLPITFTKKLPMFLVHSLGQMMERSM